MLPNVYGIVTEDKRSLVSQEDPNRTKLARRSKRSVVFVKTWACRNHSFRRIYNE